MGTILLGLIFDEDSKNHGHFHGFSGKFRENCNLWLFYAQNLPLKKNFFQEKYFLNF